MTAIISIIFIIILYIFTVCANISIYYIFTDAQTINDVLSNCWLFHMHMLDYNIKSFIIIFMATQMLYFILLCYFNFFGSFFKGCREDYNKVRYRYLFSGLNILVAFILPSCTITLVLAMMRTDYTSYTTYIAMTLCTFIVHDFVIFYIINSLNVARFKSKLDEIINIW